MTIWDKNAHKISSVGSQIEKCWLGNTSFIVEEKIIAQFETDKEFTVAQALWQRESTKAWFIICRQKAIWAQ